jgi:polysaccharide biosynthesis protein PslH
MGTRRTLPASQEHHEVQAKPGRSTMRSSPLRVLYFSPKECWPPDTGAKLRNYYLVRALVEDAQVTYLGFTDSGNESRQRPSTSSQLNGAVACPLTPVADFCRDNITVPLNRGFTLGNVIRGAVGPMPITSLHYTTATMARVLRQVLAKDRYDVVQMETPFLASYLPIIRASRFSPRVVCDWHNIESEVIGRHSYRTKNVLRRSYIQLTTHHTSRMERRIISAFDAHLVVSQRDRDQLLQLEPEGRVFVVENGVDTTYFAHEAIERAYATWLQNQNQPLAPTRSSQEEASSRPERYRVLFVGSMDYYANVDAVLQFARNVWPAIHGSKPALMFTIVGRRPGARVQALARLPGIEVTGTVDDIRPYYREAMAAVVPLRIAGGTRLKILEAMAAGVPVISTRLGAEGLSVSDGKDILFAEGPDEYCQALTALRRDELWRQALIDHAQSLVRGRYDWSVIGTRLVEIHRLLTDGEAGHTPTSPCNQLRRSAWLTLIQRVKHLLLHPVSASDQDGRVFVPACYPSLAEDRWGHGGYK